MCKFISIILNGLLTLRDGLTVGTLEGNIVGLIVIGEIVGLVVGGNDGEILGRLLGDTDAKVGPTEGCTHN